MDVGRRQQVRPTHRVGHSLGRIGRDEHRHRVDAAERHANGAVDGGRGVGDAGPVGAEGTCICNAAASVNGAVRVALGCVDAVPVLVTADSAGGIADAVRAANLTPPSDVHASSDYRIHLAAVLARRAAEEAAAR